MEQILIRNVPSGTKAALKSRAEQHLRSVEAEARAILAGALEREPLTLVDLLASNEGVDIEFVPHRLGLTAHSLSKNCASLSISARISEVVAIRGLRTSPTGEVMAKMS